LGSKEIAANEVGAWESERNAARATIDWRFKIPQRSGSAAAYAVR
jgi:hypothetical protein